MTFLFVPALALAQASPIKPDEEVILFPTVARFDTDSGAWIAPVHGWIFEPEENSPWRRKAIRSFGQSLGLNESELSDPSFAKRARYFVVDNERGKSVPVTADGTSARLMPLSGANGHFQGELALPSTVRPDAAGRTTIRAITRDNDARRFEGSVFLLPEKGLSVISDIDDTIKSTGVGDDMTVVRNTFNGAFKPIGGMPELFNRLRKLNATFHYLSAGPWQLYPSLSEFITTSGFPEGSFHLRDIRFKDTSAFELFRTPEGFKRSQLELFFRTFPGRTYVLIGDSSELDPEIYGDVARAFPNVRIHIIIREHTDSPAGRYVKAFAGLEDRGVVVTTAGEIAKAPLPRE